MVQLIIDYKSILQAAGYVMYHTCSCTGTREEKWRSKDNKDVEYVIFPARRNMETRVRRQIVCRTGIENLQSEIDKYRK